MLACKTPERLETLKFPLYVSPKLDGVRCLITEEGAMSRSMKPIRNEYVQSQLNNPLLLGLDGELIVGQPTAKDVYRQTSSGVNSKDGKPDFTFYIFDSFALKTWEFHHRLRVISEIALRASQSAPVRFHTHTLVNTLGELLEAEDQALSDGYEGLITRLPDALYKFGRSTIKEQGMVKIKRFQDAEATVIDFEELMHNDNEAKQNELGYTARSSHKENQVPMCTLGALICETPNGIRFKIGTGFSASDRQDFWNKRKSIKGMLVKYKSFDIGVKDKPRHPVFLGFRDKSDTWLILINSTEPEMADQ